MGDSAQDLRAVLVEEDEENVGIRFFGQNRQTRTRVRGKGHCSDSFRWNLIGKLDQLLAFERGQIVGADDGLLLIRGLGQAQELSICTDYYVGNLHFVGEAQELLFVRLVVVNDKDSCGRVDNFVGGSEMNVAWTEAKAKDHFRLDADGQGFGGFFFHG